MPTVNQPRAEMGTPSRNDGDGAALGTAAQLRGFKAEVARLAAFVGLFEIECEASAGPSRQQKRVEWEQRRRKAETADKLRKERQGPAEREAPRNDKVARFAFGIRRPCRADSQARGSKEHAIITHSYIVHQ